MYDIAFFSPSLDIGGAEQWMLDLVAGLNRSEIRVVVCVVTHNRCHPAMLAEMSSLVPVKLGNTTFYGGMQKPSRLRDVLENVRQTCSAVVVWELCESCLKIVDSLDLPVVNVYHREAAWKEAHFSPRHKLVAVAPHLGCLLTEKLNRPCSVVPNGVSLLRCRRILARRIMRRNWGCTDQTLVLGYIGRIDNVKNCLKLIDICNVLEGNAKLVIYGRSSNPRRKEQDVLNRIQSELGSRVRIFSATRDVGSVLGALDILVQPSMTEVMSLSILEAWAASVPVIATRVGVVPFLEQTYGQLIIPIGPFAPSFELRAAVEAACGDNCKMNIVPRAYKMVVENFTIEQCTEKWRKLISEVISNS